MSDPVPEGAPEPEGWREQMKGKAVPFVCTGCGIEGGVPYLQKDSFHEDDCMDPDCDGVWVVKHGQGGRDYEQEVP